MPAPRWFHASAHLNRKVYFTGGKAADGSLLAEALVLDMTQPWSTANPALSNAAPLPQTLAGHSMTKIGEVDGALLVAGGETSSKGHPESPILLYDASGNAWITPPGLTKNDTQIFHKSYHAALVNGKDGTLLHGGYDILNAANPANSTVSNSLITIKYNKYKPNTLSAVSKAAGSPQVARHTMTLTRDGYAIVLGGVNQQGRPLNLTSAHVLNTLADPTEWRVQAIQGPAPTPRFEFSTVMINATTMLVFGGTHDGKTADPTTYYLDIPSWTWSSPTATGAQPPIGRWGHTAVLGPNGIVVIGFGNAAGQPPTEPIALLDPETNTWLTDYKPPVVPTSPGNDSTDTSKRLPFLAVLAIAFLVTIVIVGGGFHVLVRRKKKRTRNTMAREGQGDQAPRQALRHHASLGSESSLHRSLRGLFNLGAASGGGSVKSKHGNDRSAFGRSTGRENYRMSMQTNPMMVQARLTQRGLSPAKLGYPETVIQQGTGLVQVSAYVYPNQACVETEKDVDDGQETAIVYHSYTQAQQDAIKLTKQQLYKNELAYELPPASRPVSGLGFHLDRRGSSNSLPGAGVTDSHGWRKEQEPALSAPPSSNPLYQRSQQSFQQYQQPPPTAPSSMQQSKQQQYMPPPPSTTTSVSSPPAIPMATRPIASERSTAVPSQGSHLASTGSSTSLTGGGSLPPPASLASPRHGDQSNGEQYSRSKHMNY